MSSRTVLSSLLSLGAGSGLTYLLLKNSGDRANVPAGGKRDVPAAQKSSGVPSTAPVDPAGFFKYGFPGPVHDIERRGSLVSCYDREKRNPAWVVEHFTPASLATRGGNRKGSVFTEDEALPELFRARLADYFRSGYDRGHMVPAADAKWSQQAMDDTFFLSNMCPQVGQGFNRDYWAHFEFFCRDLTKQYDSVRVMTGPLYLPHKDADGKTRVSYEVIGNPPNVAVPTHFFKLVVAEKPLAGKNSDKIAVQAFVLPNAVISNETPLTDFVVPTSTVERHAGITLLQNADAKSITPLCEQVNCQITVCDFSNKMKGIEAKKK
ncbi:ribonuclease [Maudiozyma humilis]|uniref:Endonuclease n=1 Tax=Maudiozyma humilis TaxID=51915 RepID=A0AAV5S0G7_MAUHU|nr:ribonuclease [Kazachstania humilis]